MKRRAVGLLATLGVLLAAAFVVPLSRAQAGSGSGGALLLPWRALSLPLRVLPLSPKVLHGALLRLPAAAGKEEAEAKGVIVGASYHNDTSPPLRDMELAPVKEIAEHETNENPKMPVHHKDGPEELAFVQDLHVFSPNVPLPTLNFDGIPFPGVSCRCAPPDTDGEVGLTQYVQIVNEGYQVFDKATGASVFGPVDIATIWGGFGGVCQSGGGGDPIVIYDQLADRWVVSQFAGVSNPTDECVAVSTTSDATGPYNRYGFHLGTNFFDYPKLSVWPDGYYMSMNVFNSAGTVFLGPQPFAFDRSKMLAGLPATFVSTGITGGAAEDAYLPADLDGSALPPAGAPNSFVEFPGSNVYKVYHFHADFAVPANTTFTLFASPPAAPFTQLCPSTRACVPQLGGTGANALDAVADRFMHRAAYRNFGDHESLVTNYTVGSGGVAGIRWIELRGVTSGPVTVFQESTYQPDTTWRWMGSVAMDFQGNMMLGFSASDATISPQIRYAGRLAADPINVLAQGEGHLFDGTGSQTGTSNRWGDYSAMSVDPVDDCTFWYTQEYYAATSSFNWRTRIGSFKFPGCSLPTPTPTVTGTRTDTPSPTSTFTPTNTPTPTPTACVAGSTALSEGFESGTLGAFVSTVPACLPGGCGWNAVTADRHSGGFAAFAPDVNAISDQQLALAGGFAVPAGAASASLSFWHRVATEAAFDGGVLETSIDGGASWQDAGALMTAGGYNGTISNQSGSPLGGRRAWTGTIGSAGNFAAVQVNLIGFAGQADLRFRFRLATDESVGSTGWWVDDVLVTIGVPCLTGTPTDTPVPPTNTPSVTPTNTPVPPTNTPTNTPTDTPVPATGTPTPTPTWTNSPTSTSAATSTPTRTPSNTKTPSNTRTPSNTKTNTPTRTPTRTPANSPTATPAGGGCPACPPIPQPPSPVVVTDCSGAGASPVTTSSSWTQINLPSADVVLKCALAQLPGTSGVRILAHSIKVDGPAGGSVGSSGSSGIQLIAGSGSGQCNAGATVDVESAPVAASNPNGDLKITGCGDIVLNASTLSSGDASLSVTSSAGRVCVTGGSVSASSVAMTARGDLTMHGTTVAVAPPSDNIKLTSNNGSVQAGGAACPNAFSGGIDSDMTVTAKQLIDLTGACIDVGRSVSMNASGSGFACAADVIVNLAGSEIRNDTGKPGTITVTACGGSGKINIDGAILVDNGASGGGPDPGKVSKLNGSLATQAVNCAAATAPACTTRPLDAANNPVSASPADRAAHNVVGVPRCDT